MDDGRFQVAVGAVLERPDGKVLMVRRADELNTGEWEIPTGRLKQFEAIDVGLRREVQEETGLTEVEIVTPITAFTYMRGGETAEHEVKGITFWCKVTGAEPRLSEDHSDAGWFTVEEAIEKTNLKGIKYDLRTFDDMRKRLAIA